MLLPSLQKIGHTVVTKLSKFGNVAVTEPYEDRQFLCHCVERSWVMLLLPYLKRWVTLLSVCLKKMCNVTATLSGGNIVVTMSVEGG